MNTESSGVVVERATALTVYRLADALVQFRYYAEFELRPRPRLVAERASFAERASRSFGEEPWEPVVLAPHRGPQSQDRFGAGEPGPMLLLAFHPRIDLTVLSANL